MIQYEVRWTNTPITRANHLPMASALVFLKLHDVRTRADNSIFYHGSVGAVAYIGSCDQTNYAFTLVTVSTDHANLVFLACVLLTRICKNVEAGGFHILIVFAHDITRLIIGEYTYRSC